MIPKPKYLFGYWMAVVGVLTLITLSTARADDTAPLSAAEARIRNEFDKPTSYDFVETPLADAVNFLKEKHEIEILFDGRALADAGLTTDRPITKTVRGIPFRSALNLLLRDLDLTPVIRDDVLFITTSQEADKWRTIKIYDVRDLVPDGGYDRFVGDIRQHIAPKTWSEAGGEGYVSHFSTAGIDALIVSQTAAVHEDIGSLLWKLRRLRDRPKDK